LITARLSERSARAATTAAITLSGVQTVDTVALAVGDRVLVKNQGGGNDPTNGLYVVDSGAWTRAPEAQSLEDGLLISVADGSQKNTRWILSTPPPIQVGTTPLQFQSWTGSGNPDGSGYARWQSWYVSDPAANWSKLLNNVDELLAQSGLTFEEVVELIGSRFIPDAGAGTKIVFQDDTCDVTKANFVPPLSDAAVSRMHRFVRLRRKLGWTTAQLDGAIAALGAVELTDRFLMQLSYVRWLMDALALSLPSVLSWWADIDTRQDSLGSSLYDQLFQNKSVLTPPAQIAFELNAARTELQNPTQLISDQIPGVIAGLGITAEDLAALTPTLPDGNLTLPNLSRLYRHTSLAQALKLSMTEIMSLKALSGIDPFDATDLRSAWRFVEMAHQVSRSGFSSAELDYLLRDVYRDTDGIAPTVGVMTIVLAELPVGLQKIPLER
jgi:hypothetical protein